MSPASQSEPIPASAVAEPPEGRRVVLVSPCRDEEASLERTLACIEAQTLPPLRWIVVDDGSSDRTPEILARAAARLPWMRVVRREDRGHRKLGGGVIEAFEAGRATIDVPYDYIAKLDVDLEFPAGYLRRILDYFERDPSLAAASGKVYREEGSGLVEEFMIDDMVAGQFKLYRRQAFEQIGGFVREVMWDGIDFHRARMEGYRTASIDDPELRILHLRMMGSSDRSIYRGRLRWGRGQWFMGSSPVYVLASSLFRMRESPFLIGGVLIFAGYVLAALRGEPRYDDPDFRRELRRWQWSRLRGVITRGSAR